MTLPAFTRVGVRAWILSSAVLVAGCDAMDMAGPLADAERTMESPLAGAALYVEPQTSAGAQALAWSSSRPADAERMRRIAAQPQAIWLTGGSTDAARVSQVTSAAADEGRVPVFVLYNVPQRDCAAGHGAASASTYDAWIRGLAGALGGRDAVFVLEPDALAGIGCLDAAAASARLDLLHDAVRVLRSIGGTVYLDAGHPRWQTPETMVARLRDAGIADADGFSVNVANTVGVNESQEWATEVAREVQRGFVLDTGRSGAGAQPQWCNPPDAALGREPTTETVGWRDALLWIKRPGESDGTCNGGPAAGAWWAEYALALARASE